MKKFAIKLSYFIFVLFSFIFVYLFKFIPVSKSANLTSVKDTLSSSQLSFFATLGSGNLADESRIIISGTGPSTTTTNLFPDDIIGIGRSDSTDLDLYTVRDISSSTVIQLTTPLDAADIVETEAVISTRSAIHTITFTPVSVLTQGSFEFLIKASNISGETINDGIPDQGGFDFGMDVGSTTTGTGTRLKTADITCPLSATAGVGTTTTISGSTYHVVSCTQGVGETNGLTSYTITVGRNLSSGSQLINPSAAVNHTAGQADSTADTYTFFVRHKDSSGNIVDSTKGKIAVVESVRVTATVDPSITFIIDNTNSTSGNIRCGNSLSSNADNTTATSVNFGSLNLASFNDLAQRLSCVTNAPSGYVVTAYENEALTNISTGTTISDTDCDSEDCTTSSATEWSTENDQSGFGYSIENINADNIAFNYNVGGTFVAKPFGQGNANTTTLFYNNSTPTTTERIYVCYRTAVSTTQEAGEYENHITYVATATF